MRATLKRQVENIPNYVIIMIVYCFGLSTEFKKTCLFIKTTLLLINLLQQHYKLPYLYSGVFRIQWHFKKLSEYISNDIIIMIVYCFGLSAVFKNTFFVH
jgi:hypothetical protein